HLMDDGGVVYLNGLEVHRLGLLPGRDFYSPADRVINNIDFEGPFGLPVSALAPGENVLAVELHQINFSTTDLVWGGRLEAVIPPTGPVVIAAPPRDLTVSEGGEARFWVTAQGALPIAYQWRRNGEPLPDATNAVLILNQVTLDDAGDYDVIASTAGSSATSATALLTVIPESDPPVLLSAAMGLLTNEVRVAFSETLDVFSATDLANYRITDELGQELPLLEARLWNGSQVALRTGARAAGSLYTLRVEGVLDDSDSGMAMSPEEVPVSYEVTFVAMDAVWRYDESGTDLGTSWRESDFNDAAWPQGPGLLGFESPALLPFPLQTVLTPPEFRGPVYYFRTWFVSPSDATTANLTLRYVVDDGAVFYLNGHELHRVRV
ncbi:MAG TPA: immunoglobulin domain-containing protein, partial [Verrucomicrobiae bacterium]|nr:immunoglobulin domain-containing protein [Verrucomicrobiae bacterium]